MISIFVHGLGQDSSAWDKTKSFMENTRDIACPNLFSLLSGHEPDYNNLYRAFSEYCKAYSEPIDICGLSLGAILALNYAIDNPGRVRSLTLIGAQYKIPKLLLGLQNIIFGFMPKSAFKKLGISKSEVITLTRSMMPLDFSGQLKSINCPTLIVCGEKDSANIGAARELARQIKNAKLAVIAGSGHEVNTDSPEKLAEIILS